MKLAITVISALAIFILWGLSPVFAHGPELHPNITVDHVETKLGKISEKINLFFRFNKESKVDYYLYLMEKRLAEVDYAISQNKIDSVEEVASRYTTFIQITTNYTVSNKISAKKEEIIKTYERHGHILEHLQSMFEANSGWWLAMQHTINSTSTLSEQIKSF